MSDSIGWTFSASIAMFAAGLHAGHDQLGWSIVLLLVSFVSEGMARWTR